MFSFLLGVIATVAFSKAFKLSSKDAYLKRPVLEDEAFDSFVNNIKIINYSSDAKEEQDEDRLKLIKSAPLFKKYRLNLQQVLKLKGSFHYVDSTRKLVKFFKYPLLLTEHTIQSELSAVESSIAKLLTD